MRTASADAAALALYDMLALAMPPFPTTRMMPLFKEMAG